MCSSPAGQDMTHVALGRGIYDRRIKPGETTQVSDLAHIILYVGGVQR